MVKESGPVGQAGWTSSVVNLVNTIVGAGTLAMPLALSHFGILPGIFVILFSGLTAGFGLYLQTLCARYLERGTSSFFALSQITYPNAAVIFDAAISVKCFGVGVSYLIIIGDLMPGVVLGIAKGDSGAVWPVLLDRAFWITAFMLVVIPLSFLRRLDSLKYTSVVALISIGYLVVLVVAHFAMGDTLDQRGNVNIIQWAGPLQALSSLPVVVFAFTCHQNMFSILNEIKIATPFRTTAVVVFSVALSASIYILVGITGYLSFGDNVSDNIVAIYSASVASTIGKAAIVILVMFSYPLQVHPCRASVDAVLKWRPRRPRDSSLAGSPRPIARNDRISETRFAVITTVIIILSFIVAITVKNLSTVLAYVGSTGSTSISFILPGLFYFKISDPDSALHQRLVKENDDLSEDEHERPSEESGLLGGEERKAPWTKGLTRKLALALAIYGFVIMGTTLVTNTFFAATH